MGLIRMIFFIIVTINFIISVISLYYIITINSSKIMVPKPDMPSVVASGKVLMTPRGGFEIMDGRRKPVVNSDRKLWEQEQDDRVD